MKNNSTKKPLKKKVEPGLSSHSIETAFANNIRPLLDFAAKSIPPESHNFTSVFILATAGMRLLTEEKQEDIYRTLKEEIRKNYNFQLRDSDVVTITGQEEAEYNWVAINYALGNLYMKSNQYMNLQQIICRHMCINNFVYILLQNILSSPGTDGIS